jgi:hypothetical protein
VANVQQEGGVAAFVDQEGRTGRERSRSFERPVTVIDR